MVLTMLNSRQTIAPALELGYLRNFLGLSLLPLVGSFSSTIPLWALFHGCLQISIVSTSQTTEDGHMDGLPLSSPMHLCMVHAYMVCGIIQNCVAGCHYM
jgi:hypothetical protein